MGRVQRSLGLCRRGSRRRVPSATGWVGRRCCSWPGFSSWYLPLARHCRRSVRVFVGLPDRHRPGDRRCVDSSPMYIAEISPARMRGKMVSINQFAIVAGILVAYFVNYSIAAHGNAIDRAVVWHDAESQGSVLGRNGNFFKTGIVPRHLVPTGKTRQSSQGNRPRFAVPKGWNATQGWRWMFGLGACPALLFLGMLLVVPESPRWLTKQGRTKEAMATLVRVNGDDVARAELAAIEQAIATESSSLGQLIQPGMRVALVIGITLAVLSRLRGSTSFLSPPRSSRRSGSAVVWHVQHGDCRSGEHGVHVGRHPDGGLAGPETADAHRFGGHGDFTLGYGRPHSGNGPMRGS